MRARLLVNLLERNRWLNKIGIVYNPNTGKSIKCYVDANFASGWAQADSNNAENIMLHKGDEITYAICTLLWCSKSQKEIALSTTKLECTALRQAMRKGITFMSLMKEVSFIFYKHLPKL